MIVSTDHQKRKLKFCDEMVKTLLNRKCVICGMERTNYFHVERATKKLRQISVIVGRDPGFCATHMPSSREEINLIHQQIERKL